MRGTEQLAAGKDFLAVDPSPADAEALAAVLKALAPLAPDARKRVLHASSAFYRVER